MKKRLGESIEVVLPQDSIEVSRNAKGDYTFKTKIYFDSEQGTGSHKEVMSKIETINKELVKKFG